MKDFLEALGRVHPEQDIFIRQVIMIPHHGHLVLYDAGIEEHVANVIAGTVRWAHPVDFDVTRLPALRPIKPVAPDENIGSCEPDLRRPVWDKKGAVWYTDIDKVGRYSVRRSALRQPYSAFLNGKNLGLMPDKDPQVLKRSIDRRILEARRINRVTDPVEAEGPTQATRDPSFND